MIRIYEFILHRQPHILLQLVCFYGLMPGELKGKKVRIRACTVEGLFKRWQALQQEPPKPGRAGLLPGETKEAIV
jgi:hypothetical protein